MNEKCLACSEYNNCRSSVLSWIFFIIGLIATIAIRVVTVLIHMNPIYGKIAWYVGVGGFFLFFVYKYRISQKRAKVIANEKIIEKISSGKELSKEDYILISAILCALSSKMERVNYFFIFGLSGVALVLAIYMDFIK